MKNAFEISGLSKKYKDFTLGPIELNLSQGTVMGFVGHNGAGKTTTILMLAGLLRADSGSFKILGDKININDGDWKNNIGYVGDAGSFFGNWKAHENLDFIAKFFPSWDKKYEMELCERLELKTDKKVSALSAGNKMKLQIISVLARRPKLLLLDEPANGLDPVARDEFINILFEHMESGDNSIIYSTHIISEIARLADEFTFISEGYLIGNLNKEDLLAKWNEIIINQDLHGAKIPGTERIESDGRITKIICNETEKSKEYLSANNIEIANINPLGMEDIALNILKRKKKMDEGVKDYLMIKLYKNFFAHSFKGIFSLLLIANIVFPMFRFLGNLISITQFDSNLYYDESFIAIIYMIFSLLLIFISKDYKILANIPIRKLHISLLRICYQNLLLLILFINFELYSLLNIVRIEFGLRITLFFILTFLFANMNIIMDLKANITRFWKAQYKKSIPILMLVVLLIVDALLIKMSIDSAFTALYLILLLILSHALSIYTFLKIKNYAI